MAGHRRFLPLLTAFFLFLFLGAAVAGQARRAKQEEEGPLDKMTVEELRSYQSYFYASGKRDPMTMRYPTSEEIGRDKDNQRRTPTLAEQRMRLEQAIQSLTELIRSQKYDEAIKVGDEIINIIDNEWHAIKPEHVDLIAMVEEIRSYHRMAATLKLNQDIKKEFFAMKLKVDGVVWSPMDAKAVVNGRLYAAGEVMLTERKQGDLRIEMIDEHGVVFQFKGVRFRLPVEVYAPATALGGI